MSKSVQEILIKFALECYNNFHEHPQSVTISSIMFYRLRTELQYEGRYFVSIANPTKIELFIPSYGKLDVIKGEKDVLQTGTK